MKNVVSFSLWGTSPVYLQGAISAVGQVHEFYPGWEPRFYLGEDVPQETRSALRDAGAVVLPGMNLGPWSGMFWRFLAASDPEVSVMISRDVDTQILPREIAAVDEWLQSGRCLHIMRDHPKHEMPIMGGMWGCRTEKIRNMETLIRQWGKFDRYGRDQEFLSRVIYRRFLDDSWIHTDCITFPPEQFHRFPTNRTDLRYIGSADRDTTLSNKHDRYLKEWIQTGRGVITRPHPWSAFGRIRHFTMSFLSKLKK